MKKEMIVSGYSGEQADNQVDPFLKHLLGLFVCDLTEPQKMLLDYTAADGRPDLYFATYDTETYTLTSLDGTEARGVSVCLGFEPKNVRQWNRLRLLFNIAVGFAMEID